MTFWPIVISLLVLGLAYLLFYFLPEIIDSGNSFLWVIGGFLVIYGGVAFYLSSSVPSPENFDKAEKIDIRKIVSIVIKDDGL
jgi:hypothetical protein